MVAFPSSTTLLTKCETQGMSHYMRVENLGDYLGNLYSQNKAQSMHFMGPNNKKCTRELGVSSSPLIIVPLISTLVPVARHDRLRY